MKSELSSAWFAALKLLLFAITVKYSHDLRNLTIDYYVFSMKIHFCPTGFEPEAIPCLSPVAYSYYAFASSYISLMYTG